jgi:acyl-coenzyme A synthetase/AMP-(fatty) acid ligase
MLVRHRDGYDAAFHWPDIGYRFNWALDWFDPVAAGNPRTALRIIGEDGTDRSYSFAEMAARSDRLATSLAAAGVARGDRVSPRPATNTQGTWPAATPTATSPTSAVPTMCSRPSDYKISPFELESVLIEHPAVAEAAVVPAPDPTRLAVPKAYISLAAGLAPDRATADAICAHAHCNLAPYQRI